MTPDAPFVLGYGISQKLPAMKDIVPNADPTKTPRFFIPKSYQLTATPGAIGSDKKQNPGTLNFCMLTYRSLNPQTGTLYPERNTNGETDLNAGVLPETLFQVTRTSAHDGVMGFSEDLILNYWIGTVMAPPLFIDPTKFDNLKDKGWTTNTPTSTVEMTGSPKIYTQSIKCQTKGWWDNSNKLFNTLRWAQGKSRVISMSAGGVSVGPIRLTSS
jgi:hypothetical protein